MADNQDILALLDSMPWEVRNDPTTARKIAELIAAKAAAKQEASVRYQEHSVEQNEKLFKPQMDQQQTAPQGMQPDPADVAGNPDIGELM